MFSRKRNNPLIFIPYDSVLGNCAVKNLYNISGAEKVNHILVEESKNSVWDHLTPLRKFNISKFILIAHPHNSSKPDLHLNPIEANSIPIDWWYGSNTSNIELLYAHVCSGSDILNSEMWSQVFPNWVSYNKDIHMSYGTRRTKKITKSLVSDIKKSVQECNTAHELESLLIKVFDNYIYRLQSQRKRGDRFRIMLIQQLKNNLISS
ncbi:MAG TPA: hypothetical protein DCP28_11955 [Cytophagales bacterium]|nr:hypothetical protein [Cytophagales bacterium]